MTEQPAEVISEEAPVSETVETPEPESAEAAPAVDAVDDTTETKPPQGRFDKRIGQLTGEKHALREDRDYWRDKALAREEQPKVEEPVAEPPTRPNLAEYDHDIEKYADALADFTQKSIDYKASEVVVELNKTAADATAKQTQDSKATERQTRFSEKSMEFAESNADYFEIVGNTTLNITPAMTDVLMELDNGPAVTYYLGNHPEIAYRIAQKNSVGVAIELGKIESNLGKPSPSPTTSTAPEPPNPISTSRGKTDRKIDDPDLTDKQFRDMRRKQIAAR
ncbi:hypothetical protein LCGC14_1850570 [marine sediment metagenome]|uniref:Scaffolding protein n=1 Tax=marine sediment metagenome TaxID=412755 RepID=A0A0F9IQ32_9ZZZZ